MLPTLYRGLVLAVALCAASADGVVLAAPAASTAAVKLPSTPEEHFAMAKRYQQKAAEYRQEAKRHREMAQAYARKAGEAHEWTGQQEPWVAKMEKHCAELAAASDKLAEENEMAADFHTQRGKELEGR